MKKEEDRQFRVGFLCSIVGHTLLFYHMFTHGAVTLWDPSQHVVYSVSLESGEKLGGITQVPKKTKEKAAVAPPKKVKSEPPAPKEKKPEVKKEKAKEKPKEKPASDAEVSLAEKEKKKKEEPPKPEEKVETKPKKKPTPAPKKAAPKPKTTQKKKPKEPSLSEINKRLQEAVQRYTGESTNAGGAGFGSAGRGGTGMGGGVQRPPEFFRYRDEIEYFIKSGWRWHDVRANLRAQICFRIAPSGVISDVRVCGPSGNSEFDDSALRAVWKANPLSAPPQSVYHFFREVRIIFEPTS